MFMESPTAIEIFNERGEILVVNRACVDMFGLPSLEPRWPFNLFDDPHLPDDVKDRLRSGSTVRYEASFDFDEARSRRQLRTDKSGVAHLDILIIPLRSEPHVVNGYLLQFQEVTSLRHAQDRLESYQEQLKSLASQISLVEERERRDLATALHDEIGQALVSIKIKLGAMRKRGSSGYDTDQIDELSRLVDQAIRRTRSLTFELSSPLLYELGLEPALEWLAEEWGERHGIVCEVDNDGQPKPLGDDMKGLLFNAVREALVNVAKHSRARVARVSVTRQGENICIRVRDDGVGLDIADAEWRTRGFGLFSIRERLTALGGSVAIESEVGRGTLLTLLAPLAAQTDAGKRRRG